MRSLFVRIFVSFWLIESIMFAVFIFQFANRPLNVESHFSNRIRASVITAVRLAVLRRRIEGNYGYLDALEDFRRDSRIQVWVTAPNGKELAGRTIPSDTLALSHRTDLRMAVHTEEGDFVAYAEVPLNLLPPLRARDDIPRLLIGIAVSGLICYMLSRYLTRPIDNLRRAAQAIAQGDLSARPVASRNRDHIGRLVDDFNVMADRLQATISAQKQLVSDISHELRSPLARLTVALDLARSRAGNEAQGALDRMELEANRLNDMIGRILSLAQLTSGEVHMKKQRITLAELLHEVVEDADFEARARQTSVSLTVAPGSELATTEAYPSLLRSALENVIRNAIAYTAPHTPISVHQEVEGQRATLSIRDHGPGVPDEELSKLFLPFYRVDNSRTRGTGGTGLGLAIASRAIALHGGTIAAQNVPEGGMAIVIQIPVTSVAVPQTAVAVS